MIRAGTLRDRIHIQRRTGVKDGWRTAVPDAWENITPNKLPARVSHRSGASAVQAAADISVVEASILIRRRADVCADMRVLFGTWVYEVSAVRPGRTREYLELECKLIQGKNQ